LKPELKMQRIS